MAGYKTWADLENLPADDLNLYLMAQAVPRFPSTAERTAQMGAVVEGQLSYVLGNGLERYDGVDWRPVIRSGTATLVGGTVDVAEPATTANSRIVLTSQADGGTPGWLRISARTAGTGFTITSSDAADTSTVAWLLVEPLP